MTSFTIETTYRLPVFRHRTYHAKTFEDACRQALADEDWSDHKFDPECAGPAYITGAWPGTDTAYGVDPLPVPERFSAGGHSAALPLPIPAERQI